MALLPSDRSKLALAQGNQSPTFVASSAKNINAITELYDTTDLLNAKVDTHASAVVLPHADNSITTSKYAPLSVTQDKIALGAVGAAQLAASAGVNESVNNVLITALQADNTKNLKYHFGAVGDGVTIDTQAFLDAAAFVNASANYKPKVFIPSGRYVVDAQIALALGAIFEGEGIDSTVILAKTTGNVFKLSNFRSGLKNLTIKPYDASFLHNYTAVLVQGGVINYLEDLHIIDALYGVKILTTYCVNSINVSIDTTKYGVNISADSNANYFNNLQITGTTGYSGPYTDGSIALELNGNNNIVFSGDINAAQYAIKVTNYNVFGRMYIEQCGNLYTPDSIGLIESNIHSGMPNYQESPVMNAGLIQISPNGVNKGMPANAARDSGIAIDYKLLGQYVFNNIESGNRVTDISGNANHINTNNLVYTIEQGTFGSRMRFGAISGQKGNIPAMQSIDITKPFTILANINSPNRTPTNFLRIKFANNYTLALAANSTLQIQTINPSSVTLNTLLGPFIAAGWDCLLAITVDIPNNQVKAYDTYNMTETIYSIDLSIFVGSTISSNEFLLNSSGTNIDMLMNYMFIWNRSITLGEFINIHRLTTIPMSSEMIKKTANQILKGTVTPVGSVTPFFVGQTYIDTTNKFTYFASGTTSSDWAKVPKAKVGTLTYSGDGSTATKAIPHGLGTTPTFYHVELASVDAGTAGKKYITVDATNINVNFTTAPASGTNNVVLNWRVEA